ncbi:nitrogenase molybdenum-iron protein beta chain [Parafrankia irregularis]|uniref:Nitrogenase molybdenum-iron protein beta chain n=2 Tax=Frankiaceae TaxID=74712 RepID=A0A0S4QI54_9ACTN|nr:MULTISPECIES: nitrogenase molybdenum-iron protein subunit beta [Parafrankia]MBE3203891.1 nitrogenase molybdenum-iron protein subunit beta [Parafrankia sp. CH37]CUU55237.1 nitrogenase molybdenum-iron protein beta chain [Parafrankia irregularis]
MTTTPETNSHIPLKVLDHTELFKDEVYTKQFETKREFENGADDAEVNRVLEWTRTWEYREKNFAREALTVNPAKACQPLGAVLAAIGFEGTLPIVHGSQGCVAYFRSHFARHFKEPVPAASTSMTEDAAVFGGINNLVESFANATALYKPKHIAVSTTCMAEVIGEDLFAYIRTARDQEAITQDYPVSYAHTPSFVGSHLNGYDVMVKGILDMVTELPEAKKAPETGGKPQLNVFPGFETYLGNLREYRRMLELLGVSPLILGDHSDALDSPANGEYDLYPGGTKLADAATAKHSKASVVLQESTMRRTAELVRDKWKQETVVLETPIGIRGTDQFVKEIARLSGQPVPAELTLERGRLVDALADSHAYLHGKRVAIAGDPDLVIALTRFVLECGMVPVHLVSTNADSSFKARMEKVLSASKFGDAATVWPEKDLWHLRSLVFTEPVDLLIGSTYLKYISREANVPLVRVGFPIFDRHHLHRQATIGYTGGLNLLTQLVNTMLDELDRSSLPHSFDAVR